MFEKYKIIISELKRKNKYDAMSEIDLITKDINYNCNCIEYDKYNRISHEVRDLLSNLHLARTGFEYSDTTTIGDGLAMAINNIKTIEKYL